MAYTIRNLLYDAHKESGAVGRGKTIDADDESEALSQLNLILISIFGGGYNSPTSAIPVTFTGKDSYTIGTAPDDINEEQPDIVMDIRPNYIDSIILSVDNVRRIATPVAPDVYYSRTLGTISNAYPSCFYYERSNPWGVIRFYEGTPSGNAEIIMQPSLVEVDANTDFKYFPINLKPYLVFELAAAIARKEELDDVTLRSRAASEWTIYKQSIYQGQSYNADASAPGTCSRDRKYDIYRGD